MDSRKMGRDNPVAPLGDPELSELVRQLIKPGFRSLVGDEEDWRIRARFGAGVGRVSKTAVTSGRQLRRVLSGLLDHSLTLTANQEGGRLDALDWPDMTTLPGAMAVGAADDPSLAYEVAMALGGQMRALGVAWNLAPVCDLYTASGNPALGTRSFGSDPERVAKLASAFVAGLQDVGVAATAKHFPGLGGTSIDPHSESPVLERLPGGALLPFETAIDAGAAAVMVGSHAVAELDGGTPALFSRRIVDGLLRDRLGFSGVVMTENLSIPAVRRPAGSIGEAAVRALEAGADLLLLDSEFSRRKPVRAIRSANTILAVRRAAVVSAVVDAVANGRLSRQRLAESVGRLNALTARFGIHDPAPLLDERHWHEADRRVADVRRQVAGSAVTVVHAEPGVLPLRLSPCDVVGLVRVPPAENLRADSSWQTPFHLPHLVRQLHCNVQVVKLTREMIAAPAGMDPGSWSAAVVQTHNAVFEDGNHREVIARLRSESSPVVHLATGDPADLAGSAADVTVAAYSPDRASVRAAVEILFGLRSASGRLPIAADWDRS